jgi:hypothetical protein
MLGPVFVVGITIMLKRVINFHLASLVCLSFLPMYACSNGDSDDGQFTFGSFSTTATTTFSTTQTSGPEGEEESGDGETTGDGDGDSTGDGDGDADPDDDTNGDGDGDAGDGDGDADSNDTDCPLGEFGCPCDNGTCVPGLVCGMDGLCGLGGGDGDGDPTTGDGDGDGDPYNPAGCMMPSTLVGVNGLEGELCSPPCVADNDCPAGPVGTNGACALILDGAMNPSNCVLVCDPLNDACPPGSTCKDVPDQPGLGLCTYP